MSLGALVLVLGTLVLIRGVLHQRAPRSPEPTAAQRRAWYRKRLARRRGEPDDAQLARWFTEDR